MCSVRNPACTAASALEKERYINEVHLHFTFPTDLNVLSFAITLHPPMHSLLEFLRALSLDLYSLPPIPQTCLTSSRTSTRLPINMQLKQAFVLSSPAIVSPINLIICTNTINDRHLLDFLQFNPQKSKIMFTGTPILLKNLSPPY